MAELAEDERARAGCAGERAAESHRPRATAAREEWNEMFVGIVRIELHLPAARSLKDKRSVVQGLKERIRHRVRASVAEVDHQDLWQRAALGVAVVSGERRQVDEQLQSVRHLVQATHGAELLDWVEQESS